MQRQDYKLAEFKYERFINWNDELKHLILLGDFGSQEKAIVILKKKEFPLSEQILSGQLFSESAEKYFENDKYSRYSGVLNETILNQVDIEVIYPAAPVDIIKYTKDQTYRVVKETYSEYQKFTLPYIVQQSTESRLKWIYNILDENPNVKEEVLYRESGSEGFVLLRDYSFQPDSKINNLHILAIINKKNIRSLRDLQIEHVPLLKKIQDVGLQTISQKFNIQPEKIKVFLHYLPSFYHLHVHFQHIDLQGDYYRNHTLTNVIQNIQLASNYYQTVDLEFLLNGKRCDEIFKG